MDKSAAMKFAWLTVAMLLATAGAVRWLDLPGPDRQVDLSLIPTQLAGWKGKPGPVMDREQERQLKATEYLRRTYTPEGARAADALDVFVAYYSQQKAGEAMHSPKNCLPGAGWEIWKSELLALNTPEGPVSVNRYSIQGDGRRMVVLYWYQTPERVIAGEIEAKWRLLWDGITKGARSGSLVRVTSPDRPEATEQAARLVSDLIPEMWRRLRQPSIAGLKPNWIAEEEGK